MTSEERKLIKKTIKNAASIKNLSQTVLFIKELIEMAGGIETSIEEIKSILFEAINEQIDEIKDKEDYRIAAKMQCVASALGKQFGEYDWRFLK